MSRKRQAVTTSSDDGAGLPSEVTADQARKEAQAEKNAALRKTLAIAKAVLHNFLASNTFAALADDVKDAITRLSKKAASTSAKASTLGFMQELFPEVGFALDEFELFKATKMGRAEMRKKVFYAMKKCEAAEKMWIRFDADQEAWILDAVGADMPDTWTPDMLPKVRKKAE